MRIIYGNSAKSVITTNLLLFMLLLSENSYKHQYQSGVSKEMSLLPSESQAMSRKIVLAPKRHPDGQPRNNSPVLPS
jgi:hypothetical protein